MLRNLLLLIPFVVVILHCFPVSADSMNNAHDMHVRKLQMSSDGPWPECLGVSGDICVALIENAAPDLIGHVKVIQPGSVVTMDYNENRVRVYVDANGIVDKIPNRG